MGEKIFIIGLDGATWDIIDPLIAKGELPSIKNLLENGTRAALKSYIVTASPAVWTSVATGCNPEKHGLFDFTYRKKDTYEQIPYNSRDSKCETLWKILGREGKKVGVLNVPGTYPVDKVNGFMVTGLPTPEEKEDYTYPKNLLFELRKELGKDFRFQPQIHVLNEAPFLGEMNAVSDYVYQATDYLMNNYPWDFLMTVFMGTDAIGHAFWKYMDPEHPLYDASAPKEYKHAISNIYKNIDKKIGLLQKNIGSDTTLILMSDHGFGPLHYGVSINNWLLKERFLALKRNASTRLRYWMFQRGVNYYNLLKLTKALGLTKQVSEAADSPKSSLLDLVNKFFLTNKDIDWNRTVAYSMGSGGQFFINLKGREPQGIVEPNGEYYKLVNQITTRLSELRDPNNNNIVFDEIYNKKEAYPLSRIEDNAPDIVFYDKNKRYHINRFFLFGSKELISKHPVWSGTHSQNGIFVACNDDHIRKGGEIEQVGICDIAPTVLHIMGLSIPKIMDGEMLRGIFEKSSKVYGRKTVYKSHSRTKEEARVNLKIKELKRMNKI